MAWTRIIALAVGFGMAVSAASAATVNVTSYADVDRYEGDAVSQDGAGSFLLGTMIFKKAKKNPNIFDMVVNAEIGGVVHQLVQEFTVTRGGACKARKALMSGCAKWITVSTTAVPLVFTSGNMMYTLVLDGFVEELGDTVLTSFRAAKNRSLFLQGSLAVTQLPPDDPAPVPLPAGGLLLLGALGSAAAVRSRRKAA